MTPAEAFVHLGHYTDTLVPIDAKKGRVSISMTKQHAINQCVLSRIFFITFASTGSLGSNPSDK